MFDIRTKRVQMLSESKVVITGNKLEVVGIWIPADMRACDARVPPRYYSPAFMIRLPFLGSRVQFSHI